MARTIEEIKRSLTTDFMRNADVAKAYGFEPENDFSKHFSRVSVESLLFHIFATGTWVLEKLFDKNRQEVEIRIDNTIPHRPKWYRDKALAFMLDRPLIPDTDGYDLSGMSREEIEAARVVKYAAAVEGEGASILTIKVAGGNEGQRKPLPESTVEKLRNYFREIKDAGVALAVMSTPADTFGCTATIYYDALIDPIIVEKACRDAIKRYIENLPFNGEYTNMGLVDILQRVEGVRVVEFISATARPTNLSDTPITSPYTPNAGYMELSNKVALKMIAYQDKITWNG